MSQSNQNQRRPQQRTPTSLRVERGLSRNERVSRLVAEMQKAVDEARPIDLSTSSHVEITESLRHMVFDTQSGDSAELHIRFGREKKTLSFPVRSLWAPPKNDPPSGNCLNIGTLTLRHVDYDEHVDRYLIRDNETRHRSILEIASLAKERMDEILGDSSFTEGGTVTVFQTGLESLVVGMYQSVAENLARRVKDRLPQMRILPVFHSDDNSRSTGTPWLNPEPAQ